MLQQIIYGIVPVKSMDRAIRWYTDVLGMEFIWHSEDEDLAQMNPPSG